MCKQNKKARIIAALILYVFLIMLTFLNGLDRFADYNQKDLFLGQPLVYKDAAENIYLIEFCSRPILNSTTIFTPAASSCVK